MINNERGERLQLAYEMAWFIHRNKQIAYLIALEVAYRLGIEPHHAPNGATTYQITASPATPEQKEFIKECLREFTPCDVRRSLRTPGRFRNKGEFILQLLYPERFQIVLAEAGLPTSPQPLFWPVFANTERPAGPASPRRTPPLRDREINSAEAFARAGGCRKRGHKKIAVSKSFKHI